MAGLPVLIVSPCAQVSEFKPPLPIRTPVIFSLGPTLMTLILN